MTILALVLLAAATNAAPVPAPDVDRVEFAQLTIQQRVIIRIPATLAPPPPPAPRIEWREKRGPKCLATAGLAGFAITTPDSIDLFLKGGARYRAHLEDDCPSIAFYSGFYLRPTPDGKICVGRDPIHSRAGGECSIERIRTLVPAK